MNIERLREDIFVVVQCDPTHPYADLLNRCYAALGEQQSVPDGLPLVLAGVLFDFAGFLTTRPQVIEVGATANASPMADLVKEFATMRGLSLADAAVLSWQELLAAPVKREVVIPERQSPEDDWHYVMRERSHGWNACLDEFARLNGKEVGRG